MPYGIVYIRCYRTNSNGDGKMRLYPTREASRYLDDQHGIRRTPATLSNYRVVGGSPRFRRIGTKQIAYTKEDLDAYAEALISGPIASTSEAT